MLHVMAPPSSDCSITKQRTDHGLLPPIPLTWNSKSHWDALVWLWDLSLVLWYWLRMTDVIMSWDLLWLKVRELSRLLSCCNLACIIPVLLRETGNVWDFRSWTMDPNPSWFLQDGWNGIEAKVRHVKLQQDRKCC